MTAPSLRWFFRAVLGYTVAAIALFFAATWRAETVFDSKHGLGDLRTFKLWNAIAGRALASCCICSICAGRWSTKTSDALRPRAAARRVPSRRCRDAATLVLGQRRSNRPLPAGGLP